MTDSQITPQQAGALARALTKELESAKSSPDKETSSKHYAKAESIKKILYNYQQQQKARENSPELDSLGDGSKIKILDKFNQVKKSLESLETTITRLQEEKAAETDPTKIAKLDEEIAKLNSRVNDFNKISSYLKNMLVQKSSTPNSPKQPSPEYPDKPVTRAQMTAAPKPAFSIGKAPSSPISQHSYYTPNAQKSLLSNKPISKVRGYSKYDSVSDNGGRVLTKRRLQDLMNSLAATEGDTKPTVDNDVEELLLDLADDFVESVTTFACKLAKHRKVQKVDMSDFQLHLERNWNLRVPGYTMEDARPPRRLQGGQEYLEKKTPNFESQ